MPYKLASAALAVAALTAFAATPRADEPRVQRGEASYYHHRFDGRQMANGDRFDTESSAAASRTLPLGTVAEVTNRENGQTARVVIEDRGPYARGRILDVSPRVAEELGMTRDGTAPVEVRPVGRLPNQARDGRAN
jgi:rare lipoprotein A